MYPDDLRWRIVSLIHIYDVEVQFLSEIFGPNPRSIQRWYNFFLRTGTHIYPTIGNEDKQYCRL